MNGKNEKSNLSIGFIGGGRITRIMLAGWKRNGAFPGDIMVSDTNPVVLQELQQTFPEIETCSDNGKAAGCDIVLLSLHPPTIGNALAGIKDSLKSNALLVSLAPKWTIIKLSAALSGFDQIARMIPNAPSIISQGYNPLTFSQAITDDKKKELLRLFKVLGDCPEVEEDKLEAYAIITAMGPTYLWFQFQKLRELCSSFGLTGKETDKALYEMVKGANKTFFKSDLSCEDVINLIPVKPMAENEPAILQGYETKLKDLYEKLKN